MNDFEVVRKIANRVAKKYKALPPVSIEKILYDKCVVKIDENQFGIEAYSILNSEPPIVYLNPQVEYERRKRFTIAHELGHIFIPWHNGETTCSVDDPSYRVGKRRFFDMQELEANIFASEILMPTAWLKEKIKCMDTLDSLINSITKEANASIMACLYALEHVLPAGHVIFITTDSMEYWKLFRSVNTYTWSMWEIDKLAFMDSICLFAAEYEKGSYTIKHYILQACPEADTINQIYQACDCSLGDLLNAITNYQPHRILHCLNLILEEIDDEYYVILKVKNKKLIHLKSSGCQIRIDSTIQDYKTIISRVNESHVEYCEIMLNGDDRLLWIKQSKYIEPVFQMKDSRLLLKELVDKYYPICIRTRIIQHISGVIGCANSRNVMTREELFCQLKARFSQDKEVKLIVDSPQFDQFLSNRITEIIKRRKGNSPN